METPRTYADEEAIKRLQLCCDCTQLWTEGKIDSPTIDENLSCNHKDTGCSDCISCELIRSSLPTNTLSEAIQHARSGTLCTLVPLELARFEDAGCVWISNAESGQSYGFIYPKDEKTRGRPYSSKDIPDVIDHKTTRAWLEDCIHGHKTTCGQRDLPPRHQVPLEVMFVDVAQKCLTKGTTADDYFALSYVWGGAITLKTTEENISTLIEPGCLTDNNLLPKTISDAIILTCKMGVKYLWVDCLSIIQGSTNQHRDLNNMDVIYSQAMLTIVALHGMDANSGLPGVQPGTRRKRLMSKTQGNDSLILTTESDKGEILPHTAYSSRAWTFQELVLSHRLLFVTNQEVIFFCDTWERSESMPRAEKYDADENFFGTINFKSRLDTQRDSSQIMKLYSEMVHEYCGRDLTYQTDIENAFAGLASILEDWCGGTPIIHGMMPQFFSHSMLWIFENISLYSRTPQAPGKRREGFPSWSWVGWVSSTSSINPASEVKLPVLSLIRNVKMKRCSPQTRATESVIVIDRSASESHDSAVGQPIQVGFNSTESQLPPTVHSTLSFDAERTDWKGFVHGSDKPMPSFWFTLPGVSAAIGLLFVVSDNGIMTDVFDQSKRVGHQANCTMSLVRLYQLRTESPGIHYDSIQSMIRRVYRSNNQDDNSASARALRDRLQQSDLIFILLVRRQGQYWERIGSGLMLESDWPSTHEGEVRVYQERIVLV